MDSYRRAGWPANSGVASLLIREESGDSRAVNAIGREKRAGSHGRCGAEKQVMRVAVFVG